jgi:hypothetical protein
VQCSDAKVVDVTLCNFALNASEVNIMSTWSQWLSAIFRNHPKKTWAIRKEDRVMRLAELMEPEETRPNWFVPFIETRRKPGRNG